MSDFSMTAFVGGITYIGEPRKTNSGKSVVNIGVVISKDKRNEDGTWESGGAGKYYESVTMFGALADNAVKTFSVGDRVVVIGDREPKPDYTAKDGVKHENENQIIARAIGPNIQIAPWEKVNNRDSAPAASESKPKTTVKKTAPVAAPVPVNEEDLDEEDDW